MAQTILLKRSALPGKTPDTGSLQLGEIAINTYDGKMYLKRSGSVESIEAIVTTGAEITGSLSILNGITGSLYGTASFAVTASFAQNIHPEITASYAVSASQAISSSYAFNATNALTASYFVTSSVTSASYALNADTASYFITSSVTSASYAAFALSASQAQNANNALTSSYSLNINGSPNHIPLFDSQNSLVTSAIYQSNSYSIIINQDNNTSAAPEALYVWQPSTSSYNVISGKGNLNNYLQLNIQNTNNGVSASSDVVATANNGNESTNYIDMGINNENYNSDFIGEANDAYLYSTGRHLHIGNVSNFPVQVFAGGSDSEANKKLEIRPDNQHQLTGSLEITENLSVIGGITGSLFGTSSFATSASQAINANNAISASYALTASFALNVPETASFAISASQAQNANTAVSSSYALAATSASYALTASYASNVPETASFAISASQAQNANNAISASYAATSSYADNFTVAGTLTAQTINVQTITSSIDYVTGSTIFGSQLSNTHEFTGSVTITGSLAVNDSDVVLSNQTSSMSVLSSSFATTASYVKASNVDGLTLSQIATGSVSASVYTGTGSFVVNNGPNTFFFISSSGFSGFGTSTPQRQVHIATGSVGNATVLALDNTDASNGNGVVISYRTTTTGSGGSAFTEVGAMRVSTTDHNHSTRSSDYSFFNSVNGTLTELLKISGSGFIGIRKTTITAPVDISGSTLITGSLNVSQGITGSLFGTATTASYVLNAVSASYALSASFAENANLLDGKDSSEFATTGSNTFRGDQIVTGSLFTTGSNRLIGTTTLTGSLNITGSTTQIGNNSLLGNTSLSGSVIISGSFGNPTNPNIKIYGDLETNGVAKFLPVATNIDSNQSGSYIYVSGATNDLYFSQNGNGYANTTRLRWLEGNLYTGLLNGGVITSQSSTVYQVSSGSGIIVNLNASLNDNPYPTIQYLNWPNLSASIAPLTGSYQQAFVGIDSTNNIYQQGTPFTNGQFDTVINVGLVLFQNGSTINGFKTQPSVAYGFEQSQNIFNRAFGALKLSGFTLAPSGSTTGSLVVGSGTAYSPGSNYTVDPNEPSYAVDPGTNTSKIYRYYQSGSSWVYLTNAGAGYTTIDPGNYSNNGVLTAIPAPGSNWSIQRVFWFPNSAVKAIIVYYGNAYYGTEAEAIANINIESFVEAPNTAANAIYLGAIVIKGNGVFTTPTDYKIVPGGLFRQVGGSGGGGSVVTQTLAGLSDVSISGPTNDQPLVYSTTAGKWINSSFISGSLFGNAQTATSASYALTASYASNVPETASYAISASQAISASYASQASTATSSSYAATSSYADNFTVKNTLTAQTLVVSTVSSSVVYSSGSNVFGNDLSNTQIFTGSVSITGSLAVNGTTATLGTGTINTVPKFTAANIIGNSNITDDGTLITLGSDSYVNGAMGIGIAPATNRNLLIEKTLTGSTVGIGVFVTSTIASDVTSQATYFRATSSTQAATFTLSNLYNFSATQGTFGAGSTVTAQYGYFASATLIGATNNYGFFGAIASGTNRWNLYMEGTANNYVAGALGIGRTSLNAMNLGIDRNMTGATITYGIYNVGTIQSDVTGNAAYNITSANTSAASFTLSNIYHYRANQGTFGAGSTVLAQTGFYVDNTLIGATTNYGFRGLIPASGSNNWNLYMDGTAENYLAGNTGIGVSQTIVSSGPILTTTLTSSGSGYVDGTYTDVASTVISGGGTYALFTITVSGGTVTTATLTWGGSTYKVGTTLTVSNTLLGGTGSGLVITVDTVDSSQLYVASATGGDINLFRNDTSSVVTDNIGSIKWNGNDGSSKASGINAKLSAFAAGSAGGAYLSFFTSAGSGGALTEAVRIGSGGQVGIGGAYSLTGYSLRISKDVTGSTTTFGVQSDGVIQSGVTTQFVNFRSFPSTAAASFTLTDLIHFNANQSTIGLGSTVTTQYGFNVSSTLTGATTNYGFFGNIASGTGRWNLYMAGTAANYLAGNTGIGNSPNFVSAGPILTTTLTNGGSGYVDGTYTDVAATNISSNGVYALFTIVVSGGIVITATLTWGGTTYRAGDTVTVSNTLLGGTGSGLVITVDTVDSSILTVASTTGGDITLYRNDTSLAAGENIGTIKWEGRDSSLKASGIYAEIGAFSAGTSGGAYLSFLTRAASAGTSLVEAMRIDSTGGVGIGATTLFNFSLRVSKNITGSTSCAGISSEGVIQSGVTTSTTYIQTSASTAAASFTIGSLRHFRALQGTIGAGSTVTSQYGFEVDSSLIGATNNYGFYGDIPSGTNRWNLYMNGTANNYMAGALGIGSTSLTGYVLRLVANITGATTAYAIRNTGVIQSDVTSAAFGVSNTLQTAAAAFTLGSYYHFAAGSSIGAGSTVTNQYGYFVDSTLTVATNNYGFYGNLPASSSTWNLYMQGGASNFLSGSTGIGKTPSTGIKLDVSGSTLMTGSLNVTAGITGSLFGTATTASYILNAVSASYSATSSYSDNFTVKSTLTIDATLTDYYTVASTVVGSNNLFALTTGSYTSAFFKYTVTNGTNARTGEVMAIWNGANVEYTDFSTRDLGNTAPVTMSVALAGTDVQFNAVTSTSGWTVKSLATFM